MSLESRLTALRERHRDMDRRLQEMQNRPGPDTLGEAVLKKQKLLLKEEILKVQAQLQHERELTAAVVAAAGMGAPPPLHAA